ncbi:hypothetical protein [Streptacidiphilus rugosus]|uniref:hypothetical protein n=1 Tax=Streptacidiphilus rugosus TaxID=405783 RepID=UPI00069128FF|nr:hypothetical protein [Streptacidiphilus rugosus]
MTKPDGSVRTITARHAVAIDTGPTPAVPDVPGLRNARPWTSRDVTQMHEVPQRVAVLGAEWWFARLLPGCAAWGSPS